MARHYPESEARKDEIAMDANVAAHYHLEALARLERGDKIGAIRAQEIAAGWALNSRKLRGLE